MSIHTREASKVNALRTVNAKHKHMEMLLLDRLQVRDVATRFCFFSVAWRGAEKKIKKMPHLHTAGSVRHGGDIARRTVNALTHVRVCAFPPARRRACPPA